MFAPVVRSSRSDTSIFGEFRIHTPVPSTPRVKGNVSSYIRECHNGDAAGFMIYSGLDKVSQDTNKSSKACNNKLRRKERLELSYKDEAFLNATPGYCSYNRKMNSFRKPRLFAGENINQKTSRDVLLTRNRVLPCNDQSSQGHGDFVTKDQTKMVQKEQNSSCCPNRSRISVRVPENINGNKQTSPVAECSRSTACAQYPVVRNRPNATRPRVRGHVANYVKECYAGLATEELMFPGKQNTRVRDVAASDSSMLKESEKLILHCKDKAVNNADDRFAKNCLSRRKGMMMGENRMQRTQNNFGLTSERLFPTRQAAFNT